MLDDDAHSHHAFSIDDFAAPGFVSRLFGDFANIFRGFDEGFVVHPSQQQQHNTPSSRPPPHEFPRGKYPSSGYERQQKDSADPFKNYSGRVDEV